MPYQPRNGPDSTDHALDSVTADTAERVRTRNDTVTADPMVQVNALVQRKERHGDARERA